MAAEATATATPTAQVKKEEASGKRKKLIRPRGKRGGVKHHKKGAAAAAGATATAVGVAAAAKKAKSQAGKKDKEAKTEHSLRIAKFHTLEKELARTTDPEERARIENEQQQLGGLAAYQEDSLRGGDKLKGGESGKWCAEQLAPLFPQHSTRPVRLLDVGAIAGTSYDKFPWVHVTSIDLNPRSDKVTKSDFFHYPKPAQPEDRFDVVALSLVINFVGDLKKRGEMLLHAHNYLKPSGYLYLVLPLPCLTNSRYLNHEHLTTILSSCGYDIVVQNDSKRLTRWLLKRKTKKNAAKWDGKVYKKRELLGGANRNNFAICLGTEEQK